MILPIQTAVRRRLAETVVRLYAIADETIFALCETVCGALQQSVAELAQLLDDVSRPASPR